MDNESLLQAEKSALGGTKKASQFPLSKNLGKRLPEEINGKNGDFTANHLTTNPFLRCFRWLFQQSKF